MCVVVFDDFHNKWNESIYEYVSARCVVTPYFEQIQQFIGKSAFTMVVAKEFE
jgi:hypothetical protein